MLQLGVQECHKRRCSADIFPLYARMGESRD